MSEAIGATIQQKSANAANFHIASYEGNAVDIEVSNDGFDVLLNETGVLVHTNHFYSPRLQVIDRGQVLMPDTHVRLAVARRELDKITVIDMEAIKKLMSNHIGYPDSICRHGESSNISLGKRGACSETVFSIISDVTNQTIYVANGVPCATPYQAFTFSNPKEGNLVTTNKPG